ncbi:MAG: hypothetical protein HYZ68_01035 [Chloroflexi bacterium]|nr:hypothetical protein [Chloroflexota bacterium]
MKIRAKQVIRAAVLALMSVVFAISPTIAAQKVEEFKLVNVSIPVGDFFVLPAEICGVVGPLEGEFLIYQVQITLWDNVHFVFQASSSVRLDDAAGNPVLRDLGTLREVSGTTSLPNSLGGNLVSHCTPNTATPGKLYEFRITFTLGEDGTLKQIHGELCDPSVYPFC